MTNTITLKDNTFVKIVELLKDLKEECIFTFTKEAIKVNTIDEAQISFIQINLDDVYTECKLKKDISICVNLAELYKILKCMEKDEICKIKFASDYIQLIFVNQTNDAYSKYKLKLLDFEEEDEMEDIEVEANTTLVMASKYFTSLCKKVSRFDESLMIECDEDNNEVLIKSGTEDSVELKIVEEAGKLNSLSIEEDLKVMLLLKYILIFTKGEKFSEQVTVNITDQYSPVEIMYNFDNSYIKFYTSTQDIDDDED